MGSRQVRWIALVVLFVGVIAAVVIGRPAHHDAHVATMSPRPIPKATSTTLRPTTTSAAQPSTSTSALPATTTAPVSPASPRATPTTSASPSPSPSDDARPVALAAESPPTTAAPLRDVAIYGDSLTVLSQDRYHEIADSEVNTTVHAFMGATLPMHSQVILGDSTNRLVIALGTNDAHRDGAKPWADFFNQLPSTKCVVWPKPYEGSQEVKVFNAEVAAILAPHLNVHVIDWNSQAQAHPEWIGPDQVHYTDAGRNAYADLLKQAALTCP